MNQASTLLLRAAALLAVLAFGLNASNALAQSATCQGLRNTLAQLDRVAGGNAQQNLQQAQNRYVSDGCNDLAKAHKAGPPRCQVEWQQIQEARAQLENQQNVGDVGAQREAVLQNMARFNCNGGSSATFNQQSSRGNLFQQIFGNFEDGFGDGTQTRGDVFSGEAGYETVRTVCVRKEDGYYWPISFSTLRDYAQNDLATCQDQCPGLDVDLYYYDNPGQDPDQMVNLQGQPYKSLPNAFAYRTAINPDLSCKPKITYGSIDLETTPWGAQRAIISFEDQKFPLPLRDPRAVDTATVVSVAAKTYVDIPLPRPRPAAPGEEPKPVVVQQAATDTPRIVMFGDKRVRIVGPDTPYAPTEAAGT
jgi:uncharacterized protein DUF2865